ncbi:MAG: 1-deoxy-D-xylulose-5-phosphate reductoisomerase [Chloroflexota bacterium]|nr:1-deoxy-D-xylulose-5-phosphate reductoisomerase [Chloroflexota bacterium]
MKTDMRRPGARPVRVAVLGSTGSIGTQTLDVIAAHPERFRAVALAAARSETLLREQADRFGVTRICLSDGRMQGALSGPQGLVELATDPEVDLVVVATTGAAGWEPTLAAIRAGKQVALANKEALVMAGSIIAVEARKMGAVLRPVDSEHSAIWQCIQGEGVADSHLMAPRDISKLILTASGGPFRDTPKEDLEQVTPRQALAHPTWNMGAKVTIDSATLMNKGLEVIEAHWLFDMPYERLEVVVHPQSIVHSMVEFEDGSTKAQLGVPDMRVPIQYALGYPDHLPYAELPRLDWSQTLELRFQPPELERFPCLRLAWEAGRQGGTYPTVLSAADEEAVAAFLRDEIGFMDIPRLVEKALEAHENVPDPDFDVIRAIDTQTRARVCEWAGIARATTLTERA